MRSKNQEIMNEIVSYINDCFLNNYIVPSLQEISDRIGLSKGTTSKYISAMENQGMLERTTDRRGLLTPLIKQMSNFHLIPVVGKIACGTPILAEQNIDSYMSISGNFLGAGEFFVLVAQGDSMINAGIDDGDYVVIRKQNTANEGQIVVALIDGEEATLKRFYIDKRKKKIRLHPENDNLKDMFYDTIDIQGIVVKVIKDVE
ncbi:MAG: repressor LexA [Clostridia bacterium]|nr:repressor LexA [Clostridia bacterium]